LGYEGADRWVRHLIRGFPGGAVFVVAGAKTAPRLRRATAIILAVLSIAAAIETHWINHGDGLPVVAGAVAVACGAAFISYSEKSCNVAAHSR
jgi:hypothetical protein